VITRQNAGEIYEICRLVKELGADNIKLSAVDVKEREGDYHASVQELVTQQIARAKQELESESFRIEDKYTDDPGIDNDYRKNYHRCIIQEIFAVIAADSKVYRCHQRAYTKAGEIGDLTKQSFREIWYSQETVHNIRCYDAYEECQFRCAFDKRNMLLNDFLNMDKNHINFI
jgi:radical SAM protein with 4Fe4S-binding SPASM domain